MSILSCLRARQPYDTEILHPTGTSLDCCCTQKKEHSVEMMGENQGTEDRSAQSYPGVVKWRHGLTQSGSRRKSYQLSHHQTYQYKEPYKIKIYNKSDDGLTDNSKLVTCKDVVKLLWVSVFWNIYIYIYIYIYLTEAQWGCFTWSL